MKALDDLGSACREYNNDAVGRILEQVVTGYTPQSRKDVHTSSEAFDSAADSELLRSRSL